GSSMVPIEAYRAVAYFPGIASGADGTPLVSPEMVVQPFFYRPDGGRENVLVRGVRSVAFAVHRNVRIAEGRAPRSSSGEAVIGASFGAMNTMFAAVKSRTAEIGTLRALGFSRRSILVSFVTEALAIALAGFAVGVLLAIAATLGINAVMKGVAINLMTFTTATVELRVSTTSALQVFVLATLLGLAGGFLPARRAARLSPVEALRRR